MKNWFYISGIIMIIILVIYFDPFHKPVEDIEPLIGKNFDYAFKDYFGTDPDEEYQIKISNDLNEFHGGILSKLDLIKDSTVQVYTWKSWDHKSTIWVAKTNNGYQIIDAIRYKNSVRF